MNRLLREIDIFIFFEESRRLRILRREVSKVLVSFNSVGYEVNVGNGHYVSILTFDNQLKFTTGKPRT